MSHGRASAQTREVPGPLLSGRLPARDSGDGGAPPTDEVHDRPVRGRNRVGASQRSGPKPFIHTGTWSWIRSAACSDADSSQFFPEDHYNLKNPEERADYLSEVAAVNDAYCGACPVRLECSEHARIHKEPTGVWGGQGPLERGVWK